MATPLQLDDGFALAILTPIALGRTAALISHTGPKADPIGIQKKIAGCLELFDQHQGLTEPKSIVPPEVMLRRTLLIRALDIIGKVLNLEQAIPTYGCVVETDWTAHIELKKEKRYRDHIIHPACVTAIGWWLLHLGLDPLVTRLAEHYKRVTEGYIRKFHFHLDDSDWPTLVENAWLAAGLLHDTGYPLEHHLRTGHQVQAGFGDALGVVDLAAQRLASAPYRRVLLRRLRHSWFGAYSGLDLDSRLEALRGHEYKKSHGILGAIHQLLALSSPHSAHGLMVQLAARAMVTHHDEKDDDILSDPLARLLAIADGLHAWRRPFVHRQASATPSRRISFHTIIECERIVLVPQGKGYWARFQMTGIPADRLAMRDSYAWRFDEFRKPNFRLEQLISQDGWLPPIVLTDRSCIQPASFRNLMNMPV